MIFIAIINLILLADNHLILNIAWIAISSLISYEYRKRSSFSSLPKQKNLIYSCFMSFKSAFSMYNFFTSLISIRFDALILQSPFDDLTFKAYKVIRYLRIVYIESVFSRCAFTLHLIVLEVLAIIDRLINAGYRDPIVYSMLINDCR